MVHGTVSIPNPSVRSKSGLSPNSVCGSIAPTTSVALVGLPTPPSFKETHHGSRSCNMVYFYHLFHHFVVSNVCGIELGKEALSVDKSNEKDTTAMD